MLIQEILHKNPICVAPETTLCDAYALMQKEGIRHLPVLQGEKLSGIITDRDLRLATSRLADRPFEPGASVSEVMTTDVRTAHPKDPVERSTQLMRELKIGCLPVVEDGQLIGIVTSADLLDALLRLTGVHHPSGRLDIRMKDSPGELARLALLLSERHINIHSILTYEENNQQARLVLRIGTMEIVSIAAMLCDAGFEILWPPQRSCAE